MTAVLQGPKPTLLVVDDQPNNIQVLAEALTGTCEVLFATNGEKALELASAKDIDLILLDVVMPEMNGYEVCRRLKSDEKTRKIPVVFVTAMNDVDDETRGFDVGGVDYITKPISPPTVRARVKTHLQLKATRDLLEELASIDGLTEIANRRRFDETFEKEWKRALRSQHTLSVIMLDVDFFKPFNDTYGHAQGDECLRRIALVLASTFQRPSDLPARYGGEEFAIILTDTDALAARGLIETLLENIASLDIPHSNSAAADYLTVSMGGITVVPSAKLDACEALEEVDRLLYEAKTDGRNRAVHLDIVEGVKTSIVPRTESTFLVHTSNVARG
jgi:diguanylate cyclase (GGDEF)-like protein